MSRALYEWRVRGDAALIARDHGFVAVKTDERFERRTATLRRERDGLQPTANQCHLLRRSVALASRACNAVAPCIVAILLAVGRVSDIATRPSTSR